MDLICRLHAWFHDREMSYRARAYNQGYDWAAGSLLRGQETPFSIQARMESEVFPKSVWASSFDRGACAACNRLVQANVIHDDSVRFSRRHGDRHLG